MYTFEVGKCFNQKYLPIFFYGNTSNWSTLHA